MVALAVQIKLNANQTIAAIKQLTKLRNDAFFLSMLLANSIKPKIEKTKLITKTTLNIIVEVLSRADILFFNLHIFFVHGDY